MNQTRYPIVIGKREDGRLLHTLETGSCYLQEGDSFYTLKLMIFPGTTYFLTKKKDSADRYTVFAKMVSDGERPKFLNPVGSGRLDKTLPSHMELYFPVLRSQMYMCLFPSSR
ncbi:MAG: hypothetical protein AB7F86_16735 [Bdellovibrionales bacterium]